MGEKTVTLEQVVDLAKKLSPLDKVRLIEQVVPDLESFVQDAKPVEEPLRSSFGICADLGPAPSAEDIDEIRREMWKDFPRND